MLPQIIPFITDLFTALCDFLLSEPIRYFTVILILFAVVELVRRIIKS